MNSILKNRNRIALAAALLLFGVRVGLGGFFANASDITAQSIADGVNKERSQRNMATLTYNSQLAAAAQYKASDMISRNYFSHTDPDGNYIWPKIVSEGYTPYTTLGENLAVDFPSTESLMSAWIDSPEHRANILNQAFQNQGAGVANGNGSGQFDDAMANTFGAQPTKVIAKAPAPAPTPKPQPTPTPVPVKTPAPVQKNPVAISTPTKTPPPSTPAKVVTPSPAPSPTPAPTQVQPAPTKQTSNGIVTHPGLSSASVDADTIIITPSVLNGQLNLHVVFVISGDANTVTGSVLGVNTEFTNAGNNAYSGDLTLEKYTAYEKQDLVITVLDKSNIENDTIVPLKNYPIPKTQNPTSVSSIGTQLKSPDLYNVYKYIVIGFAVLFLAIMVADTVLFRRTRQLAQSIKHWGDWNLPMILLIAGTLISVWWWH